MNKKFPTARQKRKDIANIRQKLRFETIASNTVVDATLKLLEVYGYYYRYSISSETNTLDQLLFIYPDLLKLWRENPDILACDSTYKTNKYNKPLFNICGVSRSNRTLHFGLALLEKEDENTFT